jgi:hypothetical protein
MLAAFDYYGISFVVSDTPLPQTISCNTGLELTVLLWLMDVSKTTIICDKEKTQDFTSRLRNSGRT